MLWSMLHDCLKEMNNHNDMNSYICILRNFQENIKVDSLDSEMSLSKYRSCDGDSSIILSQFAGKHNEN